MNETINIKIVKMESNVPTPKYQTAGSAGFDIACIEDVKLFPNETSIIRTGLRMSIPRGYELQLRPRSGLSYKTDLILKNSPATIDCDYTGEIKLIVKNGGVDNIVFASGERICQGVFNKIPQGIFQEVNELVDTKRGNGGLGHTGK
jgi:dUTP pyrophosphatase